MNLELPEYLMDVAPSPQSALDIFAGEWWNRLAPPYDSLQAGNQALFNDWRLNPINEFVGGLQGKSVLELGPREGHHSHQYWKRGCRVTAIEGNARHFLKCLIVKELYQMDDVRFLCGNFLRFLQATTETWDLCSAIGVLYHMRSPLELLSLMSSHVETVHIWTHYYDRDQIMLRPEGLRPIIDHNAERMCFGGYGTDAFRHDYTAERRDAGPHYMGGLHEYSFWLPRQSILDALEHYGFGEFVVHADDWVGHGPAFMFSCRNRRGVKR